MKKHADQVIANGAPGAPHRVIGTSPPSEDAVDKALGRADYAINVKLPGMIHGRILRSPHAHARILSIETSRAEALPGVLAVATWRDLRPPDEIVSPESVDPDRKYFRDSYLASDKVLYCGHPVVALAATDPWLAEVALTLIDVAYEVLPPVLDPRRAAEDTSPLLHEEAGPCGRSNVVHRQEARKGDVERGFAEADVIVEREFRVATVNQGYLEPQVAVAAWTSDRSVKLWSATQGAFYVRRDAAALLGIPVARVKVIPMEPGGAFGGRNTTFLEPVAALLARKAGRPVRMIMTRAEVFEATSPSSGCTLRVKMGATRAGLITAATASLLFESGAYRHISWADRAAACMFAPYDIPNGRIEALDVLVNKPKSGAYRAPSATHAAFAYESIIDELSEKIGMDPMAFRLQNAAREGTRRIDGKSYARVGFAETMRALTETEHYQTPLAGPFRGRGVACGWWPNNGLASTCSLGVNPDGSVNLTMGSIDLGSNARTAVAMQAAEALVIPLTEIHVSIGDTDSIGYTATTGGSRTTFATGLAAIEAARELLRRMGERAAELWKVDAATVSWSDGIFTTSADPARRLTFKEVAATVLSTGGPIFVTASVDPTGIGSAMAAHIVDLEVDPETGKVTILRYTAVQDVGKAIHPVHIEGQIHGAVAQGIGRALSEGYQFSDQGKLLNRSFLDYRMPTMADLPSIETVLVEVPNPGHPYGVRGVAEPPVTPPPAAIAIAIHRALGIRLRELPMSPERVFTELHSLRRRSRRMLKRPSYSLCGGSSGAGGTVATRRVTLR
ncbi:MAG: xanthine dehydrogenase family protein molybdopterin-binding subunit [Syntrophales bacterium]